MHRTTLASLILLLVAGCAGREHAAERGPSAAAIPGVSEAAMRLHRSAILVDGHNDLPWELRTKAESSFEKMDISKPVSGTHTDIPRLRAGGVGAQFWSVFVPADTAKKGVALHQTLEQIDVVHRMIARYPETFAWARTADDVVRIHGEGTIACLIGAEGGHSIEGSLGVLRMLYDVGVRYMTLTHSDTNDIADSATDEPKYGGLSPFGKEVVREMNRLGMLIDISHVSQETMEGVLALSKAPVIASHSSCRALADHPRNVPDEVLRKVAANGGVVMINFYSGFLVDSSAKKTREMFATARELRAKYTDDKELAKAMEEARKANPIERGTVKTVVDHIDHVVRVAGIDCVGLGSDFDGIDTTPEGLEDVSCYPRITQEMMDRGYSEEAVRKVLGGNVLRALKRAEEVARTLAK
jgi:membrane dipeptidase